MKMLANVYKNNYNILERSDKYGTDKFKSR